MNSNCNSVSAKSVAGHAVSPCDEAYDILQRALVDHESLLDALHARLEVALRAPAHVTESSGPVGVENPAVSDLHGRLMGTARRVQQQNNALHEILDRLTL